MRTLLSYLRLMRLPTVFTAMADIVLGFLLTHRDLEPLPQFALLLVASSGLYLGGMVFNDVFDRHVDSRERPERPIPSGSVPLAAAIALGTVLVVGGVAAAALAGIQSFYVALLLVLAIFAYDGGLKRTPVGPLVMGSCRFLNVMLGASGASDRSWLVWAQPQIPVALGLGLYIAGVTWFARQEAGRSSRPQLAMAMGLVNLAVTMLIGYTFTRSGESESAVVLMLFIIILFSINRRLAAAVFDPLPQRVQPAVRTMLLSLVMLDAALVFWHTGHAGYALMTACFVIPAVVLSRLIAMT